MSFRSDVMAVSSCVAWPHARGAGFETLLSRFRPRRQASRRSRLITALGLAGSAHETIGGKADRGSEAAAGGFPICLAGIEKICYKIPMDRIQIAVDGGGARERVGVGSNATRSASWAPGQFFLLESAVTH